MARPIRLILADVYCYALFGLSGFLGVFQTPDNLRSSETALQQICSVAGAIYGIAGVIAGIGLALRKRWTYPVSGVWGAALVLAGLTAPPAWAPGETPWWGVLLGGVIVALLVAGVFVALRALLATPAVEP